MTQRKRNLRPGKFMMALACLLLTAFGSTVIAQQDDPESSEGRVYVMTNAAAVNSIVVLRRDADGSLTFIEEVPTGGQGSGPGALPPRFGGGPGPNPLTSSYSLTMSADHRFLLAANAGSNDISVLAIEADGLRLVDKVPSGGTFPVSIAVHERLVYVLNQRGTTNIAGFLFAPDEGRLRPIPNSTQPAGSPDSSDSAVAFSPSGRFLVVTETLANLIHVFRIGEDGRAEASGVFASLGRTPSAATFTHDGILAVTEADEISQQTGAPNGSSMSTYSLSDDGALQPISQAVPDGETASCWVLFTADARFAYVSSMGGGAISSFSVSPQGELSLLNAVAADTGGLRSVPLDIAMTRNSEFLYVLTGLAKTVKGYRINDDGSLTPVASLGGFPVSMQGIVAR